MNAVEPAPIAADCVEVAIPVPLRNAFTYRVPDALRGRSVGQALVKKAVEDARAEGKQILPLCPFAKAQIAKHAEWQDVLQK